MTEIAERGRSIARASRDGTQGRSIASVLVLVALITAVALLARGAVVWGSAAAACLAAALGLAGLATVLHRPRVPAASRAEVGQAGATSRRGGAALSADARRHRRFVPARRATTLHMQDGRQIPARIVDISIAGVAVEARLSDAEMMTVTQVGSRAAGPIRRTPTGAVFGFDTLLEPQPFDASFAL